MIFGGLWIIFSDQIIYSFFDNPAYLTRAQTYKGWFFILITGFLLYVLVQSNNTYLGNAINDLNESRNRFRDTFEQAAVGIAHHTKGRNWLRINNRTCELLGYSQEELLTKNYKEILHPEDIKISQNLDQKLLNKKIEYYRSEQRYIRKDGSVLETITTKSLANKEDDDSEYFITIIEDISKQKEAENKLKDTIRQKEMLLAELHHRVKNNLALITALSELQLSFINDESRKKIIQDIRMRIKTIALAHDSFSDEKAKAHLNFSNYLHDLLSFIEHTFAAKSKNIIINRDIDQTLMNINQAIPCGMICNELVSNAYLHAFDSNSEKKEITVSFKKENDTGVIEISDNGAGLKEEGQFQDPKTFGFMIVKTLSQQLSADVEIHNNSGTRFLMRFELAHKRGPGSNFMPDTQIS